MSDGGGHVNDETVVRRLLTRPATWAVVGLSANRARTAYGVGAWMRTALGLRLVPVNPRGEGVFGEPGFRSLAAVPDGEQIAVVDCFVNSRRVGEIVDQAIAERDRLGIGAVWLQLGVVDQAAAVRARAAGLDVVMDTCPHIQAPRLGIAPA
ncbi:MAG: CoA-binding protein [Actinomycetota bacterium]